MMKMSFGRHNNKLVAWVLIEDAEYFSWMKSKGMDKSRSEYRDAMNLLQRLDSMPFSEVSCTGEKGCTNPVTRLSLYKGRFNGQYWLCDSCNPYSSAAMSGSLTVISTAQEALFHPDANDIIKAMARAKGAPKVKTEKALAKFFGD